MSDPINDAGLAGIAQRLEISSAVPQERELFSVRDVSGLVARIRVQEIECARLRGALSKAADDLERGASCFRRETDTYQTFCGYAGDARAALKDPSHD
jgi:hypothetical protein